MKANTDAETALKRKLCNLEQTYWKNLTQGNIEGMRELWHKRFVGWPAHSDNPVNYEQATESLRRLLEDQMTTSCILRPCAFEFHGDIAIVHYRVDAKIVRQGKEEIVSIRMTHTWLREQEEWRIIGGMSAI
jgi:hypothetical protein